jgi:hypothetical protein
VLPNLPLGVAASLGVAGLGRWGVRLLRASFSSSVFNALFHFLFLILRSAFNKQQVTTAYASPTLVSSHHISSHPISSHLIPSHLVSFHLLLDFLCLASGDAAPTAGRPEI